MGRHEGVKVLLAGKGGVDPAVAHHLVGVEVEETEVKVELARVSISNVLNPPEANEAPHIWSLHWKIRISRF